MCSSTTALDPAGRTTSARTRAGTRHLRGRARPRSTPAPFHRIRAGRIVVATGAIERPLVFPGNDLVGVMLPRPSAARRQWSSAGRGRCDQAPTSLAGVTGPARARGVGAPVVDLRDAHRASRRAGAAGVRAHARRAAIDCDVSCLGRPPARVLLLAGRRPGRVRRRRERSSSAPVGSRGGRRGGGDRPDADPGREYAAGSGLLRLHALRDVTGRTCAGVAQGYDSIGCEAPRPDDGPLPVAHQLASAGCWPATEDAAQSGRPRRGHETPVELGCWRAPPRADEAHAAPPVSRRERR
jgi:hypothetical protein